MTLENTLKLFRKTILGTATIVTYIDNRAVEGQLIDVFNLGFPSITFQSMGGSHPINTISKQSEITIEIQIHSTDSYQECSEIWELVKGVFFHKYITDDYVRLIMRTFSDPVRFTDTSGDENIYRFVINANLIYQTVE